MKIQNLIYKICTKILIFQTVSVVKLTTGLININTLFIGLRLSDKKGTVWLCRTFKNPIS